MEGHRGGTLAGAVNAPHKDSDVIRYDRDEGA